MKKILSLLMVFLLLLTAVPFGVFSLETEVNKITAKTVLAGGQGVGFYDTSESGTLETSGTSAVVLRKDEWTAYDISSLGTGYYTVSVTAAVAGEVSLTLSVDNKEYSSSFSGSNANTYVTKAIFQDLILQEAAVLKVKNNSETSVNLVRIQLERVIPSETVIEFENVLEGGEGIGYHDNGKRQDSFLGKLETSGKTVCLRDEEWTAYDVSSLEKGLYVITLKRASTALTYLDVFVDSYLMIKDAKSESTGSYGTYKDAFLGTIYIDENVKSIKVENSGTGALYADYLTFFKISDDEVIKNEIKFYGRSIYSNVEGEGFHDEEGKLATNTITGSDYILHKGDWAAYDVSDVEKGVYDVSFCYASKAKTKFDVLINGSKQISKDVLATGTSYSTFIDVYMGKIYLDDTDKLTVLNSASGSAYLRYIKLKKSSESIDELYKFKFEPTMVIPGGQGVGYYDNLDLDINHKGAIETSSTTNVVLRNSEWLKYDISYMRPANYNVYARVSSRNIGNLKITTDASEKTIETEVLNTGDYSIFETIFIGTLDIGENDVAFKLENANNATIYINEIRFEMIPLYESLVLSETPSGTKEAKTFSHLNNIYLTGEMENVFNVLPATKVLAAFYDGNGRLLSIEDNEIDVKIGETGNVSIPISVNHDAMKMKVLLWSSVKRAEPLLKEHTIYAGITTHLYVDDENGNNANSGYYETEPLKTIAEAQERVRNINDNMYGDIYVHLNGDFEIDQKLEFGAEDSGTNGFSVIYDGDGETTLNGGKKISGFTQVSGTPLYKTTIENIDFRQLYVNGNRAQRARSKWLYFAKGEYKDGEMINQSKSDIDGFVLSKEDFTKDFEKPSDMEFIWMPSWKNVRVPVESMERNADGDYIVKFEQPYFDVTLQDDDSQPFPKVSIPFYIENAPEFLDEAGEWYYNKETSELFYYPLENEDMETADVVIPKSEMLVAIEGSDENRVKNITFKGIEFSYGAWNDPTKEGFTTTQAEWMTVVDKDENGDTVYKGELMPAQVKVDYGDNINFVDNKFTHLGSVALAFDNKTEKSKISGNVFDDLSATAVMLSNPSFVANTPVSDFVRNVEVSNNLIRRVSVEYMTPAITAYYVNNVTINHNDILDCPYTGISLGWGWGRGVKNCTNNTVSGNKIENVLYKLKDGGHIYTLDVMTGTVFENNYLIKSGEWKGGIYLDNATKNLTIRNNVFEDCERWLKLTWHNVIDNTAYNNYSETGYGVTPEYLETNNIEEAKGKVEGVWGEEAQAIINNAGLSDEYKHLLTEYNKNTHFRNAELKRLSYIAKPGVIVPAGELISGGEGVAYHDKVSTVSGIGITDEYNGTGHRYIMNTSQGEWTKHSVTIPKDGTYKLILNGAATSNNPRISIWIDDEKVVDKGRITNTGTYNIMVENEMATVNLKEGNHIIKVEHTVSNFGFYYLRFENVLETEFDRNDGFDSVITDAVLGKC